ncbi:C45 family autoproteolytic acyltransferase/hydolase [Tolumonas lignilytica]|jgi:Aminopeptidase N|uniref:C45 family autoproteolytic acyltransferase/hydolase n=1 Tax=Tolumonas lignilytica TaxID=1283284 RepID=UPI0004657062|nr:C45 family autoproteolytic acyltransferase/hydolase [Tolumonas lignilytica]
MKKAVITAFLALVCCYAVPSFAATDKRIDPNTVQWWGPAYRYPQAGWINIHIEGEPHERGVQHGRLLAPEIAAYVQALAQFYNPKSPEDGWDKTRDLVKALFLRGFTPEQLEEMDGIAVGASASGAQFFGRHLDIIDIAALNLTNEIDSLNDALAATPNGLDPVKSAGGEAVAGSLHPSHGPVRCDAFAAVGSATKDGKVVFGHITMFDLLPGNYYNVWLDVKPSKGHRFVMQTTPGGIHSGMDYSINDAGLLLSETTVGQTSFESRGIPLAARIRQAQQYADNIEQAASILTTNSNGLSTTEWILADVKKNEIALLTLGTHEHKLYRSSQKEWIAGAEGFYWSNNNTKDRNVRLETVASMDGRPSDVAALHPVKRDALWLQLYEQNKGKIDTDFARQVLTNPEIVLSTSVDAKYTTSDMAQQFQTWATFGPSVGVVRYPSVTDQQDTPVIKPLVSNPWVVLGNDAPIKAHSQKIAADLHDPNDPVIPAAPQDESEPDTEPAWHGTLLPKNDADIWLTTAFANYERIVALEKNLTQKASSHKLSQHDVDTLAVKLFLYRARYELAVRAGQDFPLSQTKANFRDDKWYDVVSGKGVLVMHALRSELGEQHFDKWMDEFGLAHAGQEVTTGQFKSFLEKKSGKDLSTFFHDWLDKTGMAKPVITDQSGLPLYTYGSPFTIFTFDSEVEQSLIVYGTQDEEVANKEAAQVLQKALQRRKHHIVAPIMADRDVTAADLQHHHLLLIGRPDSNSIVDRFKGEMPVTFGQHSFQIRGTTYAHPESGLILAAENPLNRRYSMVLVAGLSSLGTLTVTQQFSEGALTNGPVALLPYNQGEIDFVPKQH